MLVGGWPASGKTTLARALAGELALPYLGKDEVKESLMDVRGAPPDVAASQRLHPAAAGRACRADRRGPLPYDA